MLLLYEWSWCPHVRILFLSTPLFLNMWSYFSISASAWGQARSKLGGVDTSILHHAFISMFISLWAVITRYVTILMSILSYFARFTMKRGNAGSWDSGWKRTKHWKPILHNSKSVATPRKSFLELIRIIGQRKYLRGPTPWPGGWGASPYRARPCLLGPLVALWCPSSPIWGLLSWKKSQGRSRDETPPPRGGTLAEPIQGSGKAVPPGTLPFGRGKSSPSSSPMILLSGGGQSPSTSSPAPFPLQTLVHLLYPILYQNHKLVPVGC